METDRHTTVVILYRHPLFGEGIEHLLAGEPDLDVTAAPSDDLEAMARSLAAAPDVVIYERGCPDTAVEVLRAVPDALVIDVALDPGPTFTYHREEIQSEPSGIVEAIRRAAIPHHAVGVGSMAIAMLAALGPMGGG